MEKLHHFNQSEEKLIEKIIDDDVLMVNHIIFNKDEFLPEHNSNSNVYMVVVRGTLTLQLAENPTKEYAHGSIVNIPGNVKMNVSNRNEEQLEFFVLKAPSPRLYKQGD